MQCVCVCVSATTTTARFNHKRVARRLLAPFFLALVPLYMYKTKKRPEKAACARSGACVKPVPQATRHFVRQNSEAASPHWCVFGFVRARINTTRIAIFFRLHARRTAHSSAAADAAVACLVFPETPVGAARSL